jgi:hypothetical protein
MADVPGGVAVSDPIDLRLGDCLDVLKTIARARIVRGVQPSML